MKKEIDLKIIEESIRNILEALGDDPNREGLVDTPKRVAKMYSEVFKGMTLTNDEIAEQFGTTFEEDGFIGNTKDIVVVRNIDIFSYCEHHLALMYNMKVTVGYLPKERVVGLSKIARVADMVGRRLQLQERIGKDIAEIIAKITGSDAVCVLIHGAHSCMTARGIEKPASKTTTVTYEGKAFNDPTIKQEFLLLMQQQEY